MFVSASNVSYGIGQRIENCRLMRGHTQIGLASQIGLTYQEVNSYEDCKLKMWYKRDKRER